MRLLDEALLVFAQADHAAEAAGEIQRRMEETAAADDLRLGFRIGIHFGAAIAVSGDVFGDSVNVAARMVGRERIIAGRYPVAPLTSSAAREG